MGSKDTENTSFAWRDCVAEELGDVESTIKNAIASDLKSLRDIADSIVSAGGKRIRPSLILLSYYATGGTNSNSKAVEVAAAAELLHTASLLHDDVIDEAKKRRGRATANSIWGNKMGVLSGDYLLAQAFKLLANKAEGGIIEIVSSVSDVMAESQVLEIECTGSLEKWKENYWRCINGKTAAFMGACCESGGVLSSTETNIKEALREYGLHLGVAFQISDDILDICGRESAVGKDIGSDILAGKYTLPLLLAVEKAPQLAEYLNKEGNGLDLQLVIEGVNTTGAIDSAKQIALEYSQKAIDMLGALEDSTYKRALVELAEYTVNRNF